MYETLKIFHFLGLALGLGTSFAMFTLGIATKDLDGAERAKFMMRASALSKNGSIGLLLLIVSGARILFDRGVGNVMSWGGAFHAKLTLVVVLCGLVGAMQATMKKAKKTGDPKLMARLPVLGRFGLPHERGYRGVGGRGVQAEASVMVTHAQVGASSLVVRRRVVDPREAIGQTPSSTVCGKSESRSPRAAHSTTNRRGQARPLSAARVARRTQVPKPSLKQPIPPFIPSHPSSHSGPPSRLALPWLS